MSCNFTDSFREGLIGMERTGWEDSAEDAGTSVVARKEVVDLEQDILSASTEEILENSHIVEDCRRLPRGKRIPPFHAATYSGIRRVYDNLLGSLNDFRLFGCAVPVVSPARRQRRN